MAIARILGGSLLAVALGCSAAGAVESDPLPMPRGGARLAEAHNNLAFSLRMEGPHNQGRGR